MLSVSTRVRKLAGIILLNHISPMPDTPSTKEPPNNNSHKITRREPHLPNLARKPLTLTHPDRRLPRIPLRRNLPIVDSPPPAPDAAPHVRAAELRRPVPEAPALQRQRPEGALEEGEENLFVFRGGAVSSPRWELVDLAGPVDNSSI